LILFFYKDKLLIFDNNLYLIKKTLKKKNKKTNTEDLIEYDDFITFKNDFSLDSIDYIKAFFSKNSET